MIIEYKKKTQVSDLFEEKLEFRKYKLPSLFEKFGFKTHHYPDLYIHTGSVNAYSKKMFETSKISVVNSGHLKDELVKKYNLKDGQIEVIFPINDVEKFKKKEVKKEFYEQYNIPQKTLIIYFTAQNFQRNGFESFCDIITKVESDGYRVFVTCTNDKELDYANSIVNQYELQDSIKIIEEEIFQIADIFVLPTQNKNFSYNVVKALSNKCVVFLPQTNNAAELLDVFSIMDDENDSNTAYKIDMLLRVPDEFKKIRKESYSVGKKLNKQYLQMSVDKIIEKLS